MSDGQAYLACNVDDIASGHSAELHYMQGQDDELLSLSRGRRALTFVSGKAGRYGRVVQNHHRQTCKGSYLCLRLPPALDMRIGPLEKFDQRPQESRPSDERSIVTLFM
jgi:hypothetical protein